MTQPLDEAILRIERIEEEVKQLLLYLHDIKSKRAGGAQGPPRPRAPSVAEMQPGQPAPTTYGARDDRAATADMKRTLRAVAKGTDPPMVETDLDAMALRKFKKPQWNMVSQREYMVMLRAIESGER